MKGKAIIPLALGLCIGLIAVKFGVDAVKRARGSVTAQETVKVVRAKVDIDAYAELKPEMLELIDAPSSSLIPANERFATIEELVSKIDEKDNKPGRVTAKAIPQFSPVLAAMLAPPGTQAGMIGRIPEGFRAVSAKIDEVTGVAYQIKPGDWVDVIVVMDVQSDNRRNAKRQTIAEVILQNIQVAAIGQDANVQQAGGTAKVAAAKSATLLVAETDVPKLHLAATRGKITLAMRGKGDIVSKEMSVVRDTDVFAALKDDERVAELEARMAEMHAQQKAAGSKTAQAPVADPDTPHSIVVRKGSTLSGVAESVERITFENANSSNIIGVSEGAGRGAAASLMSKRPGNLNNPARRDAGEREPAEPENPTPDEADEGD